VEFLLQLRREADPGARCHCRKRPGFLDNDDAVCWCSCGKTAVSPRRDRNSWDLFKLSGTGLFGPITRGFSKLARAMPAVSRALTHRTASPPDTFSISILNDFITVMVDHLVRSSTAITVKPIIVSESTRRKRSVTHESIHDQWLYALRSPDDVMTGAQGTCFILRPI